MPIAASASRFACLQDDDSADWKAPKGKSKPKKEETKKVSDNNKPKDASKAKALKEAKELQNLAFGGQKKKNKKKGSQQQQPTPSLAETSPSPTAPTVAPSSATVASASLPSTTTQYEEWKEKDKVLVEDNFTAAMQEAILQSKLEFEQQQATLETQERLMANGVVPDSVLVSLSKEERKRVVKQQKKPATMSLDQFNTQPVPEQSVADLPASSPPQVYKHPRHKDRVGNSKTSSTSPAKELREGGDFFNEMDVAAVKALDREQLLETYRSQEATNGSESALVANYREKVVEKDQQLQQARAEVQTLSNKLTEAKLRCKKLTEILMSGEMKEKTEVLVEVHKLEKVRDELSSSLTFTSGQLEQERSLVHQLEIEMKKGAGGGGEQDLCNRLLGIIRNRK